MIELNTLNGNMNDFDTIFSPRYFPPDPPITSSPLGTFSMYVPNTCVPDIEKAFDNAVRTKAHDPICNLIGYEYGKPVYKEDKPVKYIEW